MNEAAGARPWAEPPEPEAKKPAGRGFVRTLRRVAVIAAVVLIGGFALWTWLSVTWVYSTGDRAGYVQKFSKKGVLFKTWEGELAMANLPGAMPEVFVFSCRDDSSAARITESMGRRVRLTYNQHVLIPVSWFGETEYFVVGVHVVE